MTDLQGLIKKRGMVKATLTNIKKFTDKFGCDSTQAVNVEQLETRIERLNESWKEFHDIEYQIMLIDENSTESDEFEDRFYEIKAVLKRLLNVRNPSFTYAANNSNTTDTHAERSFFQTSELRLPRILIEQFGGDYAKWQSFQDQFETSIHSKENLSNIHKFQYLKSLLKNEAASLVRHMALTDANYLQAWEKLKKRYSKKKYSVRELIELFLSQPSAVNDEHTQLRAICDTSDEVLRGLEALGSEWQSRDPWLIHILIKKLNVDTQQAWAKHSIDTDVPTIDGFLEFLTERCDALEACTNTPGPIHSNRQKSHTKVHAVTTNANSCVLCNSTSHPLFRCFKFKRLSSVERKEFIESRQLCSNCLNSNHRIDCCQSPKRCFICGNKHHTLLHVNNQQADHQQSNLTSKSSKHQASSNCFVACANTSINEENSPSSINSSTTINDLTSSNLSPKSQQPSTSSKPNINRIDSKDETSATYLCATSNSIPEDDASTIDKNTENALLSTVVFHIQDGFGIFHTARALLDSGSQTTLISESCIKRIGLSRNKSYITINGLASQKVGVSKGEARLRITSRLQPEKTINVRAVILNKLTSKLPASEIDDSKWPIVQTLNLADPHYNVPGTIDVILGNDIFYEVLLPQKIKITNHLYAQSTIFGWVLGGQISVSNSGSKMFHTTLVSSETENELIQRFWELEEFNVKSNDNSTENLCETHYVKNTIRSADGRYITRLPIRNILSGNQKISNTREKIRPSSAIKTRIYGVYQGI